MIAVLIAGFEVGVGDIGFGGVCGGEEGVCCLGYRENGWNSQWMAGGFVRGVVGMGSRNRSRSRSKQ